MKKIFLPITNEEKFRTNLLRYLLNKYEFKSKINDTELDKIREDFDQYRMDNFDFFPGVRDLLSELRQSYTLVVITNGPTYSQHPKVDKVGVREIVDHVIIGGEEPEEKPFKSIFMKACGLANCKPKEAIHVGDSLAADISGAVNAGIKSVWISPEEKHDSLPDHIITNFIMIPSILDHYKNL